MSRVASNKRRMRTTNGDGLGLIIFIVGQKIGVICVKVDCLIGNRFAFRFANEIRRRVYNCNLKSEDS
jgi:hypothetical protein